MFQGRMSPNELGAEWKIYRSADHSGIMIEHAPLGSVHTHWITTDPTTARFNTFVLELLDKLAPRHPPAKKLLNIIRGTK